MDREVCPALGARACAHKRVNVDVRWMESSGCESRWRRSATTGSELETRSRHALGTMSLLGVTEPGYRSRVRRPRRPRPTHSMGASPSGVSWQNWSILWTRVSSCLTAFSSFFRREHFGEILCVGGCNHVARCFCDISRHQLIFHR